MISGFKYNRSGEQLFLILFFLLHNKIQIQRTWEIGKARDHLVVIHLFADFKIKCTKKLNFDRVTHSKVISTYLATDTNAVSDNHFHIFFLFFFPLRYIMFSLFSSFL